MKTTEVVLYQIKEAQVSNYAAVSRLADEFLQHQKGFISRVVKQDHSDDTVFLDLVEWETLEDAVAASEAFKTDEKLLPFFGAFDKVISFHHFQSFNSEEHGANG